MTASRIATVREKFLYGYVRLAVYPLFEVSITVQTFVFFSKANFVSILATTTTFLAFHVMLSSSRNQLLYPTGIVPYPISYTMTIKPKKTKTDGWLFLVFYMYRYHRKRREEYFWFACVMFSLRNQSS